MVLHLVPFLFLVVMNLLIWRAVKSRSFLLSSSARRERRDLYVASILILIIIIFLLCHSIKCAINVLELVFVLAGIPSEKGEAC